MKNEKQKLKIKKCPNFTEELKLWKKGYKVVVGVDEAGRGPLAGPVVAAALCVKAKNYNFSYPPLKLRGGAPSLLQREGWGELRDSKKLSLKQREKWYKILTACPNIKWGIGIVSEKMIDKINIFEATKLAMRKAVESLKISPDFLLLDGKSTLEDLQISQKAIVKADEKVFSCAAASIIAKVTRDRIMIRYGKKYPEYQFDRHKGYGTRLHFEALKKHGPCEIHRKTFRPIKNIKASSY